MAIYSYLVELVDAWNPGAADGRSSAQMSLASILYNLAWNNDFRCSGHASSLVVELDIVVFSTCEGF